MLGFSPLSSVPLSSLQSSAGGPTAYALTCATSSYAYTGVVATLTYTAGSAGAVNYALTCATSSYSYTGVATTALKHAHPLVASAGAYTYTGIETTSLRRTHSLTTLGGSYTYSGIANTNLKVTHVLNNASGSYSYTGTSSSFKTVHSLTTLLGSYTYTGTLSTLSYVPGVGSIPYVLSCNVGVYNLVGLVTYLKLARAFSSTGGSYNLVGKPTTLTYVSHAPVSYILSCYFGHYEVSDSYSDTGYVIDGYVDGYAILTYVSGAITYNRGNTVRAGIWN